MGLTELPKSTNMYIMDAENAVEIARLIEQDALFTGGMGVLFPEGFDLSKMETVLDIGCGPGSWVIDVAFTCPHMDVTGVDISKMMIDYARARAQVRRLENALFRVMDALQPLDFPDDSFDLINGRFLTGFMDKQSWPGLLQECRRILRPGGYLCLTECEAGYSTSLALQRLNTLLFTALKKDGRSFSPDGQSIGMLAVFKRLLKQAGLQDIHLVPYLIDSSYDSELYHRSRDEVTVSFKMLEPFLVRNMGLASQQEFDTLYHLATGDMYGDFGAVSLIVTAWGKKSTTAQPKG
jgi:ubiquinone/menaquinone biosynthesis C-methylase UbiE